MEKYKGKILIITQAEVVNTIGGGITAFVNFCNELTQRGYYVTGCCYADENNRPCNLKEGIEFINLKFYYRQLSYKESLNQYLDNNPQDLIIFFFPWLYGDACLSERHINIPKILMFHSRPDWYLVDERELEKIRKQYVNTTGHILLPSFYRLLPKFIQDNGVICVPNSLDLPTKYVDIKVEKKRIIYLSRIDPWKGHEFLINSWSLISKKYPDWQIHIYGQSTPPDCEEKLKKHARKLGVSDSFIFKGVTDKPLETFLSYDFCVFPSMFEGFGLGLAEALSVGLPSIGLKKCSAINELIIDGKNGFLTDFSPKDFAEHVEKLINDRSLREKMSNSAIESVKCFDRKSVFDAMDREIRKILLKENNKGSSFNDVACCYDLFSLDELGMNYSHIKLKFWQKIFSIKKYKKKKKTKIQVCLLGLKFRM